MAEPQIQIQVTDRLSPRELIEQVVGRAQTKGEPIRVRIPFMLYAYGEPPNRGYVQPRDASWNLQIPSETATVASVERVIDAMGTFVRALGVLGADGVIDRLTIEGL